MALLGLGLFLPPLLSIKYAKEEMCLFLLRNYGPELLIVQCLFCLLQMICVVFLLFTPGWQTHYHFSIVVGGEKRLHFNFRWLYQMFYFFSQNRFWMKDSFFEKYQEWESTWEMEEMWVSDMFLKPQGNNNLKISFKQKAMRIRINIQGTGHTSSWMYSSLLSAYCCRITSVWYGSIFSAVY